MTINYIGDQMTLDIKHYSTQNSEIGANWSSWKIYTVNLVNTKIGWIALLPRVIEWIKQKK